ncbi:MAG TPA: benzoyl-CoA 2,3-epoxidase subunit BoxB [Acidimicrobiales bacterium]|nr:benzoyl-CoA 2,3-epoxidase subunit BoxB [Acidimicrobiales bacterium]
MTIDYSERIPNNVALADDRRLQRALEAWQPRFAEWWMDMGPAGWQDRDVYLRTAVDVSTDGWAHFDYVKMPEYRWGIFLAERVPDRTIGFGERLGQPAWQEVPGEHRSELQRMIVIQGDTEPASVEQQRHLGATAPSLYDLRNLFQINVEEGRHLWAMVYLLHAHFGRDGRDEADELLRRRSGDADHPRILGAFNEPTPDWLSFFFFTYFTDRDGRFQLAAQAESGFDPLARTCQFMLREEAHHMFVGTTGVGRVVQRTCDLMREHDTDAVSAFGGIDLATLQRYLNLHFSVSLDLFGHELSANGSRRFAAGLKGRFNEGSRQDDHILRDGSYQVAQPAGGRISMVDQPAQLALNACLRDDYIADCAKGVARWNRIIAGAGIDVELALPSVGFHRQVGLFAGVHVTPEGRTVDPAVWDEGVHEWLPTEADRSHVHSVMRPVQGPGLMAGWIAAPGSGIHNRPPDFEYVLM